MRYTDHFNTRKTSQSEAIPGSKQVKNSAGGYSFEVDIWTRLDRFLILGSEGGSYYATEKSLTVENAKSIQKCIDADGKRLVARVVEISDSGRAPKNDPAIFALAMAAKLGNDETRRAAREAISKVCRTGTHIFTFVESFEALGSGSGWGRGTRNAIAKWYNDMPIEKLGLQVVKYQQRNGWSHRDLLRLSHPKTKDPTRNAIYKWVTKGVEVLEEDADNSHAIQYLEGTLIHGMDWAMTCNTAKELCEVIRTFRLPHECVPTQFKNDPAVQEALLESMPMTALVRNLANMTKSGLLAPLTNATGEVIRRLTDDEALRKARVHPIAILAALMTYKAGHGMRGKGTWTPVTTIVDALDEAFYKAFQNVRPTGKRILLALDVSGSMTGGTVAGIPGLTPRIASAAMAMVIARTEKNHAFVGFSSGRRGEWMSGSGRSQHWGYNAGISQIDISSRMRLDSAIKEIEKIPMGGTDCALPMLYADAKGLDVDAFIVLTDNETWAGEIHPSQALQEYRRKRGIPAKSVVVGMVSNAFTIADPNDAGMMDVVGFDTAVPQLITDFIG